jgi:4-diphosphocytidyl-2-C-methyl-D-erythritol kinase
MVVFPHCKINLGLRVLRKRPDGYHDLDTCFYPVPWTDMLEIIEWPTLTFTTEGRTIPGDADSNLCLRAFRLLAKDFRLPNVHIHLHKLLPLGAGLGGGSSDGAFVLKALNDKFGLGLSVAQLAGYAAQLGSDCAFFVHAGAMMGRQRGDMLSPVSVSLKGFFIVIVKPSIHVSTAEAYAGIQPAEPTLPLEQLLTQTPLEQWKRAVFNDFEVPIFKKYPAIGAIKQQLYQHGAIYASMSGSGSAVFGIFSNEVILQTHFLGCDYWSGLLA